MIWFNGFPFLDSKEDHVFNVPVSQAMTADPVCLPGTEFPVREAEHLLNDNRFRGFPVVEDRTSKTLIGYIGRTEIRYAIDKARSAGLLAPNARCIFTIEEAAETAETVAVAAAEPSSSSAYAATATSTTRPADTFDAIQTSLGASFVDFSRYVDHTPLTVHPRLPLETVMDIFKKMGPRVILVERRGRLMGLVTVKDCLKYQFKVEAEEHALAATASPTEAGLGLGLGLAPGGGGGGAHRLRSSSEREAALEQRVWTFLQWVGSKLAVLRRTGSQGARGRGTVPPRSPSYPPDASSGGAGRPASEPRQTATGTAEGILLEGTEDDDLVELSERR